MCQEKKKTFIRDLVTYLFWIPVEEQINNNIPFDLPGDRSPQAEHLTRKQPPHKTNAVGTLVVAGDGNVHKSQWGVSVTKCNDWYIDITSLRNRLVICCRIRDNQQPWLPEGSLYIEI